MVTIADCRLMIQSAQPFPCTTIGLPIGGMRLEKVSHALYYEPCRRHSRIYTLRPVARVADVRSLLLSHRSREVEVEYIEVVLGTESADLPAEFSRPDFIYEVH